MTSKPSAASPGRRTSTPECPFGDDLLLLLSVITHRMTVSLTKRLRPLDLSFEQWSVLACMAGDLRCTPSTLPRSLCVDRATVPRRVRPLEERGLVVRQTDPDDHRCHRFALTAAGRALHRRAARLADAVSDEYFAGLTPADRERLRTLLAPVFLVSQPADQGDRRS